MCRYSSLEKNCEYGAYVRALEKGTLQDNAKSSYAQRIEERQAKLLRRVTEVGSAYLSLLDMGWALKRQPRDFHVLKLVHKALQSPSWPSYLPLDRYS